MKIKIYIPILLCSVIVALGFFKINFSFAQVPSPDISSSLTEIDGILESLNQLSDDINGIPSTTAISTNPCIQLTRTLVFNDSDANTGGEVSMLQSFLKKQGFFSGTVTGNLGFTTEAALKQFQINTGLVEGEYDGKIQVGPDTRAKIKSISCNEVVEKVPVVPVNEKALVRLVLPNAAAQLNMGTVDFGKETQATLTVKVLSGKPIFSSLKGLTNVITYAGGAFPGNGGTCKKDLIDGCTIMINFKPVSSVGELNGDRKLIYKANLSLEYVDNGVINKTDEIIVGGSSPLLAFTSTPIVIPDGRKYAASFLRGDDASIKISFGITGVGKNIRVIPATLPFIAKGINCKETESSSVNGIYMDDCYIIYDIDTTNPGSYSTKVGASYSDGEKIVEASDTLMVNVIGSSDTNLSANKNLLIVYNTKSTDGKKITDYYLENRPGFSDANVLPVDYPGGDGEISTIPNYKQSIEKPLNDWIKNHPEKDIRSIVLVRGIPSRVYDTDPPSPRKSDTDANTFSIQSKLELKDYANGCVPYGYGLPTVINKIVSAEGTKECETPTDLGAGFFTKARFPESNGLITSLDMGSTEATLKYIDKLKTVHDAMKNPSIVISASNADLAGTKYYFEDINRFGEGSKLIAQKAASKLKDLNGNTIVDYRSPNQNGFGPEIEDVAGLITWGVNGSRGAGYAKDGNLRFTGKSDWFLIQTVESFNGMRDTTHGNYISWFSKNAFGGSDYDKTPAAAIAHVDEPGVNGLNTSYYFPCWNQGNLFIDCAWFSRASPMMEAIGDPWIRK